MDITSPIQFVNTVLASELWHTTSPERFGKIIEDGRLKAEPMIPERERHKTANGSNNYPFVRKLGGISLFSFHAFDQAEYQTKFPLSNWMAFVPVWHAWKCAIWIQIDSSLVGSSIIEGSALLDRWKSDQAYRHTIMPLVEAAHIGDLPTSTFKSVLRVTKRNVQKWTVEPEGLIASQSAPAPR